MLASNTPAQKDKRGDRQAGHADSKQRHNPEILLSESITNKERDSSEMSWGDKAKSETGEEEGDPGMCAASPLQPEHLSHLLMLLWMISRL